MKHNMRIKVAKHQSNNKLLNFKNISIREKFMRLLFGSKRDVMVLVPGDSVKEVEIHEIKEGEKENEQNEINA
jgi:hypothetical protein